MGGSPLGLLPLLVGQLLAGFAGFLVGGHWSDEQFQRVSGDIIELASQRAFSKCQELVEIRLGGGDDKDPEGSSIKTDGNPNTVLGLWWFISFEGLACLSIFGWIICLVVFCLSRQLRNHKGPKFIEEVVSPSSEASQKVLAHQQLAEIRLRRLNHGAVKPTSPASI